MTEPARRHLVVSLLAGAVLWGTVSLGVGYLVGAQRQFSRAPVCRMGQEIAFHSRAVTFIGWFEAESQFRWTDGRRSRIVFRPEALDPARPGDLRLTWNVATTLGRQPVSVTLNGQPVGAFVAAGFGQFKLTVPRALLRPLEDNEITTEQPEARQPGSDDPRYLSHALRSLQLDYLQ